MLTQQTLQQLQSLNLLEMALKWQEQQRDPQMAELSFDERFGLLVDSQSLSQHSKRIAQLRLRGQAPSATSLRRGRRFSEEPRSWTSPCGDSSAPVASWETTAAFWVMEPPARATKAYVSCALGQAALTAGATESTLLPPRTCPR